METQSLAMEMTPVIMWWKGREPEIYRQYWSQPPKGSSNNNFETLSPYRAWDMLSGKVVTLMNSLDHNSRNVLVYEFLFF